MEFEKLKKIIFRPTHSIKQGRARGNKNIFRVGLSMWLLLSKSINSEKILNSYSMVSFVSLATNTTFSLCLFMQEFYSQVKLSSCQAEHHLATLFLDKLPAQSACTLCTVFHSK